MDFSSPICFIHEHGKCPGYPDAFSAKIVRSNGLKIRRLAATTSEATRRVENDNRENDVSIETWEVARMYNLQW